jgi:hypothetical protein
MCIFLCISYDSVNKKKANFVQATNKFFKTKKKKKKKTGVDNRPLYFFKKYKKNRLISIILED